MTGGNSPLRARWLRTTAAVAIAGLALVGGAGAAQADTPAVTTNATPVPSATGTTATADWGVTGVIFGAIGGKHDWTYSVIAVLKLHGDTQYQYAYGLDPTDAAPTIATDGYIQADWPTDQDTVGMRGKIQWVMSHSMPNVAAEDVFFEAGLPDNTASKLGQDVTDNVLLAATQAAVWHYTSGFVMDPWQPTTDKTASQFAFTKDQYAAVQAVFDYLIGAQNIGQNGAPTLTLTPGTLTGTPGQLIGPFTVHTTAAVVNVDATNGAQILGADKKTPVASIAHGETFWVKLDKAGTSTVTATGYGSVADSKLFIPNKDVPVQIGATSKSDAPALPKIDSTPAPTKTEYVPTDLVLSTFKATTLTAKVTVTAAAAAPSTVPPAGAVNPPAPELAATGVSTTPQIIAAVLLLVVGGGLTFVARRRRHRNA